MLILAVDTSGQQGSIALARGDGQSFDVISIVPLRGGTFSAQLVPQISELLAGASVRKEQIDSFAVASGPGSFTGLRVGLAAIKALAEILHKPIAAVSMLQAIAAEAKTVVGGEAILVAQDAGRNQIYVGEYRVNSYPPERLSEEVVPFDDLTVLARKSPEIVTAEKALFERMKNSSVECLLVLYPGSIGIVRLGIKKILAGEVTPLEVLDANYIRRSDAELFSLPKIQERTR